MMICWAFLVTRVYICPTTPHKTKLRHALVMSYHVGGLYAATLGMMFVLAEFQPPSSRRLLATIASLMSFGMVAAASIVDGDLSMAFSTAPPVVVWTVIGTIGAATVALSKDPSGGRSKAD